MSKREIVLNPRRHGKTAQMWDDLIQLVQQIEDDKPVFIVPEGYRLPDFVIAAKVAGIIEIQEHSYLPKGAILQTTVGKLKALENKPFTSGARWEAANQ